MRSPHYLISVLVLAACTHTDPYHTEDPPLRGPLEEPGYRLTYNLGADSAFAWSADGNSMAYTYNGNCIGILPREGGTRRKEMCDTRSAPVLPDFFQEIISAVAQHTDQRVIFFQTAQLPSRGLPVGGILVILDPTAPLDTRKILATFPMVVADSVLHALTELRWIDQQTFVAVGHRVTGSKFDPPNNISLILRNPRMLVRGTLEGHSLTLAKISGTDNASQWALGPEGSLLFVKGEWVIRVDRNGELFQNVDLAPMFLPDSIVMSVPLSGGTPTEFATAPRRLRSLSCEGTTCIALGGHLDVICGSICRRDARPGELMPQFRCPSICRLEADPLLSLSWSSRQFQPVAGSLASWTTAQLSPTRPEFIYVQNGDLFRREFTPP